MWIKQNPFLTFSRIKKAIYSPQRTLVNQFEISSTSRVSLPLIIHKSKQKYISDGITARIARSGNSKFGETDIRIVLLTSFIINVPTIKKHTSVYPVLYGTLQLLGCFSNF